MFETGFNLVVWKKVGFDSQERDSYRFEGIDGKYREAEKSIWQVGMWRVRSSLLTWAESRLT